MNGLRMTAAASIIAASAIAASATIANDMPKADTAISEADGLQSGTAPEMQASVIVAETGAPYIPAPAFADLPGTDWQKISHLVEIEDPADRKNSFIAMILPRIRAVNETIAMDRAELLRLTALLDQGEALDREEFALLRDLRQRYRAVSLEELRLRIDEIPEVLALAQAALESGWGTSDLAQESLSFFGHTRGNGEYAVFTSISESIEAYARNLNTHAAYKEFRKARAEGEMTPWQIAATLEKYSELGQAYTKKVRNVMRSLEPHREDFLFAAN